MPAIIRLLLCCCALPALLNAAQGSEPFPHFDTFLEGAAALDDRGLGGGGGVFAPLWYDAASLLFLDVRGQGGAYETIDANFGLGLRHRTAADWIVGGYAYFDRTHVDGNTAFNQAAVGVELLSVDWAFRLNGYLPSSDLVHWSGPQAIIDGGTLVVARGADGAYGGTDFETGYLLREWKQGDVELRGYVGGFYFSRSEEGFDKIAGPRVRAELRLYDLPSLGPQSRLVAAGQYQWDEVRGSLGLLSIGLRVAFGDTSSPKLTRIQRRMVNPVQRLPGAVFRRGLITEPALLPDGAPVLRAAVIDADTPDPAAALAGLGEQSIAVFDGSAGPIDVSQPLRMNNDQIVVGGGISMKVQGQHTGAEADFHTRGERPLIQEMNGTQDVFVLAESGAMIAGVDVTGGRNGIVGRHTSDFTIVFTRTAQAVRSNRNSELLVSGNGILLDHPGANGVLAYNRADSNYWGIKVLGDFDGHLAYNKATGNLLDGIEVTEDVLGSVAENEVLDNGDAGIRIRGRVLGDLVDNTARQNDYHGIFVGAGVQGDVSGNTLERNDGEGLRIEGVVEGSVTQNHAEDNERAGIVVHEVRGDVLENVGFLNGWAGLSFGHVQGDTRENLGDLNGGAGLLLYGTGGDVIGNTLIENGVGLQASGEIEGAILNNIAWNNDGEGILLELYSNAEVIVTGNNMQGNNDGLYEFKATMKPYNYQPATIYLKDNVSTNIVPYPISANYVGVVPYSTMTLIDQGGNVGVIGN